MKKTPVIRSAVSAILFLAFATLHATHNRAGEITYKRIPPYTKVVNNVTVAAYTYSIIVTKYHNSGQGVADRCADTVYFGDGQSGIAPRVNGSACGDCGGTITCGVILNAGLPTQVKVSIYTVTHTYPGPGSYLIRSFDPNRNQGINNIPNSVNYPFYIESYLVINSFTGANSSPTLSVPPIGNATTNACYYHNPGALDPDGDSLSYEITTSRGMNGNTAPGYTYPDAGQGGTYVINAVTGQLTWCNPQMQGAYALAFIIKEWRKNTAGVYQMIGYVLRDMEVLAVYGPVGLKENPLFHSLVVSPNPASGAFTVNTGILPEGDVTCSLFSLTGNLIEQVRTGAGTQTIRLEAGSLAAGVYFIKVEHPGGSAFRKVIKE